MLRILKKFINTKNTPGLMSLRLKVKSHLIPKFYTKVSDIPKFRPVLLIATNRSGSSLLGSLIAQNPEVEGIFGDEGEMIEVAGHTQGFLDSCHLWQWLENRHTGLYKREGDGCLWGHPKHISNFYKDTVDGDNEHLRLINDVQRHRKTTKRPFIKDALNCLRIGMLKEIYPDAKIIFNIRDYDEYIKSCSHNWLGKHSDFSFEPPKVGLHWHTLNSTILWDLNKYYPGQFTTIHHNDLYRKSKEEVHEMINQVFEFCELPRCHLNLDLINPKYKYIKPKSEAVSYDFKLVEDLVNFEKSLKL